jgi:hypothetical protein
LASQQAKDLSYQARACPSDADLLPDGTQVLAREPGDQDVGLAGKVFQVTNVRFELNVSEPMPEDGLRRLGVLGQEHSVVARPLEPDLEATNPSEQPDH